MHDETHATALCAKGVTKFAILLSDFCYPTFCLLLMRALPPRSGQTKGSRIPTWPPPWAGFENHCFCVWFLLTSTISLSGSIT